MAETSVEPDLATRLRLRAALTKRCRAFFDERGVVEVDTPALSASANPDPAIEPIAATPVSLNRGTHYLHTSPEFTMKRLLAAGSGDIFQLCRVFRDGELGRWHEPEFVMLEWYRLGFDEHRLMAEVAALLNACLADGAHEWPAAKFTYADMLMRHAGIDPHRPDAEVVAAVYMKLEHCGIQAPPDLTANACLDLAFSLLIVPVLPAETIVFIHDYPAAQAALAEIRATTPPVAARFEVFVNGVELGNGYRELTDPGEQRIRFERDLEARRAAGAQLPELDADFLAALRSGLPPCAGVALGFDRLAAVIAGAQRLADVINFPHSAIEPDARPID
jgi:lysyl-tRNA synthetase class 2